MNTQMTHSNNIPTSGIINVTTNDQNTSCSNNNTSSSSNKLYKGVRKRKWGKWVSEIRLPNSRERIWLGSYDTQEKAARAFDAALYCLRGCHASFNFPNTPLTINVSIGDHKSLSPQEIQEIAAKFANEYSPPTPNELSSTQEEDQLVVVPLESQHSDNSNSNSYSCPLYDNDESVQLDYGDLKRMDWRFEDMLDDNMNNGVANCSDFGPYYGLDKMQYSSELQYSTQVFEEHNVDQIEYEDVFSNDPSFL